MGGERGKHRPSDGGGKGDGKGSGKAGSGGRTRGQGRDKFVQTNRRIVAAARSPTEFEALLAQLRSEGCMLDVLQRVT